MDNKKTTKKTTTKKKTPSKSPTTAKKTPVKKTTTKTSSPKKTTPVKKTNTKPKTTPKKTTTKKAPVKKTTPKKVVEKKVIKKEEVIPEEQLVEEKYRSRLAWLIVRALIVIVLIISIGSLAIKPSSKKTKNVKDDYSSSLVNSYKEDAINKCLSSTELPKEVRSKLQYLETDLFKYLANYNISLKYGEFNNNYEISYRSDEVYYGASLIKIVDAIYLVENDVDLSITKRYESRFRMGYSSKVSTYKIGDMISLKNLLDYAIRVSDNSAHLMLIDYIGFNNLQNYGQKLGGKAILSGGDLFGNQTADDMAIYLKKAYELINNYEDGILIKDAMLNTEENYLNFDDVVIGHKYGSYESYYHDVGINFEDNPYYIVVLSTLDRNRKVITEVSKKVYNIHKSAISLKEEYCNSLYQ